MSGPQSSSGNLGPTNWARSLYEKSAGQSGSRPVANSQDQHLIGLFEAGNISNTVAVMQINAARLGLPLDCSFSDLVATYFHFSQADLKKMTSSSSISDFVAKLGLKPDDIVNPQPERIVNGGEFSHRVIFNVQNYLSAFVFKLHEKSVLPDGQLPENFSSCSGLLDRIWVEIDNAQYTVHTRYIYSALHYMYLECSRPLPSEHTIALANPGVRTSMRKLFFSNNDSLLYYSRDHEGRIDPQGLAIFKTASLSFVLTFDKGQVLKLELLENLGHASLSLSQQTITQLFAFLPQHVRRNIDNGVISVITEFNSIANALKKANRGKAGAVLPAAQPAGSQPSSSSAEVPSLPPAQAIQGATASQPAAGSGQNPRSNSELPSGLSAMTEQITALRQAVQACNDNQALQFGNFNGLLDEKFAQFQTAQTAQNEQNNRFAACITELQNGINQLWAQSIYQQQQIQITLNMLQFNRINPIPLQGGVGVQSVSQPQAQPAGLASSANGVGDMDVDLAIRVSDTHAALAAAEASEAVAVSAEPPPRAAKRVRSNGVASGNQQQEIQNKNIVNSAKKRARRPNS